MNIFHYLITFSPQFGPKTLLEVLQKNLKYLQLLDCQSINPALVLSGFSDVQNSKNSIFPGSLDFSHGVSVVRAYVVQRITKFFRSNTLQNGYVCKLKNHLLSTTMPRVHIKYNPHIMNRNRHPVFQRKSHFIFSAWQQHGYCRQFGKKEKGKHQKLH